MKKSLGIYLHIPFCIKKCGYCDFCSFPQKGTEDIKAYANELCRRISATHASEHVVDTIYFGGGTPSLLPVQSVDKILDTITSTLCVDKNAEITLECNPATADHSYFKNIREMGVNRLSMGLQSAIDHELALLGRAHSFADFLTCFDSARAAGFDNVSVDLMYGIPDQTLKTLETSLNALCRISPEHISTYGLSIEENTPFYRQRASLDLADDDMQAQMYLLCSQRLSEQDYQKYEISNFAKNGLVSRHNTRYWKRLEYLGFGVSAHSFFNTERFSSSRDIEAFLEGKDITDERYTLTDDESRQEYIMLSLRLCQGLDINEYEKLFCRNALDDLPQMNEYVNQGFMQKNGSCFSFTDKGFLVSNALLSDMLDFS